MRLIVPICNENESFKTINPLGAVYTSINTPKNQHIIAFLL